MQTPSQQHLRSSKRTIIMIAVAALAVLLLLVVGWYAKKMFFSTEGAIDRSKYQAVFLTNGQVYFGKLANIDSDYAKLNQIYYLQVQQQVQPEENSDQQQPQVSLTKLGNELHGPEDSMQIARDQILFWENLKDDGKVVQAIKEHQKQ
jgi:hypothetical protein